MELINQKRYFLKLAYKGTNYKGWQIQPNAPTIQEEVNKALYAVLREEINVTGCGRTDAGVHARCFYAHFDTGKNLLQDKHKHIKSINHFLPEDVSVYDIIPVKPTAHARFDATARKYEYYITRLRDPILKDFSYYYSGNLNLKKMISATGKLFDYKDFTSFSKLHTDVKTNNCEIIKASWKEQDHILIFSITADRFLRNMVRAIVGTLMEVGKGKISVKEFAKIIESKNRSKAGMSVPAKGLFLTEIFYPSHLFEVE